jgi:hypothetical protein
MSYPDFVHCVSLTKASGEKIEAARSLEGLQAQHVTGSLKKWIASPQARKILFILCVNNNSVYTK